MEQKPPPPFNPFNAASASTGVAKHINSARLWLAATAGQAVVTCCLLGVQRYLANTPKEQYVRMIVTLGIVATWSLALRTIRARVIELLDFWQKASKGLIRKASESGRHLLAINAGAEKRHSEAEVYVKGSIRRLRIIAAGLTIPFFVMPVCWSIISVFLSIKSRLGVEYWCPIACFMLFSACIVAGYFYWAIVPAPQPVRTHGKNLHARRRQR